MNHILIIFFFFFFALLQLGKKVGRPGLHLDGTQQRQPVWHRSVPLLPHHVAALTPLCFSLSAISFKAFIHTDFINIFLFSYFCCFLCTKDKHVIKCYSSSSLASHVCFWLCVFEIYNKETDVLLAEAQSQWNMPSLGRYISLSISLMSAFH